MSVLPCMIGTVGAGYQARGVVDECVARGLTAFETADVYGPERWRHVSDCLRPNAEVSVKVGLKVDAGGKSAIDSDPESLRSTLSELDAMRGESVFESIVLHRVGDIGFASSALDMMQKARRRGVCRKIGVSEVGPATLRNLSTVGEFDFVANEVSPFDPPSDEMVSVLKQSAVKLRPYRVYAGGFWTGRWQRVADVPSRLRQSGAPRFKAMNLRVNLRRVAPARQRAQDLGVPLASVVLSWVSALPEVEMITVGLSSRESVRVHASAVTRASRLTPECVAYVLGSGSYSAAGKRYSRTQMKLVSE